MWLRRFASLALAVSGTVCGSLAAQPAPTAFESFANTSSAAPIRSIDAGSLTSADSSLRATVLVVEDRAAPGKRMIGVRFDLTDNSTSDHVFLDAAQLARLEQEMDLIVRYSPFGLDEVPHNVRIHGTESCWMPSPAVRILCPGVRIGADWSGLSLGALGGASFAFRGRAPADLLTVIDRARREIESLE